MNRDHYAILCKEGVIEVRSGNDDADVILNPTIVDFLKMIASDRIWGNEGSILEISNSLGIRLLIFCYWFDRLVSHDFRIET
ncbi:GSCOCG00012213001-RA-CDS [Cotesia congregata]|nr:GSCOCG00012213001-RA-CDS [Cotesia congregata]